MLIPNKHCGYRRDGLRLYPLDMGDSPPPPDYGPMAAASEEAARLGAELGRETLAENRRQYDQNMAIARPIVDAQGKLTQQAYDQGGENFRTFQSEGRPLQRLLRDDAMGITSLAKQRLMDDGATKAVADVSGQLEMQRGVTNRNLGRMGVMPTSGRYQAMQGVMDVEAATAKAGAASAGRTQAGDKYYAKLGDTFNTYAGLGSSAPTFYAAGTSAGNSAVGNQNSGAASFINGMAAGNQTIMQGQGQKVQGFGSILNAQSAYANSVANQDSGLEGLGTLVGAGVRIWSDRRLKENIVRVSDDPRGFGIYEFNYIARPNDRYRGVMADEVEAVMPQAVLRDAAGFMAVDYTLLGIPCVEV